MKKECLDRGTLLAAVEAPVSGGEEGKVTAVRGGLRPERMKKMCLGRGTLLAAVEAPVSGGTEKVSVDRREMVRITVVCGGGGEPGSSLGGSCCSTRSMFGAVAGHHVTRRLYR